MRDAHAVFVSSKVTKGKKAPLIVALHGLGGNQNTMLTKAALDLAEEGGYIMVGVMEDNCNGWYGAPAGMASGAGPASGCSAMGGRGGGPGRGAPGCSTTWPRRRTRWSRWCAGSPVLAQHEEECPVPAVLQELAALLRVSPVPRERAARRVAGRVLACSRHTWHAERDQPEKRRGCDDRLRDGQE